MVNLQIGEYSFYIGLAVIGIFSGLGNAIGQYVFNEIIKPRIHPHVTNGKALETINKIGKEVERIGEVTWPPK